MTKVMVGCIENDVFFQPDSVYYAHPANYMGNKTLANSIFGANDDTYSFRPPTVEEFANLACSVDRQLELLEDYGFSCCVEDEPNIHIDPFFGGYRGEWHPPRDGDPKKAWLPRNPHIDEWINRLPE